MSTTTAENTALGTTLTYAKGEVVFWGGNESALGRMVMDYDFKKDIWADFEGYLSHGYDSLHYSNLRPSTEAEKAILGDREFVRYTPK